MVAFESDLSFNLEKLAFLLDTDTGKQAVKALRHAEDLFADLRRTFDLQQALAQQTQQEMVEVYRKEPGTTWAAMDEALGPMVVSRGNAFFGAVLQRVEQDPFMIASAFELTRSELVRRFGGDAWGIDFPIPEDSASAKPPLPEPLLAWLATLPQD